MEKEANYLKKQNFRLNLENDETSNENQKNLIKLDILKEEKYELKIEIENLKNSINTLEEKEKENMNINDEEKKKRNLQIEKLLSHVNKLSYIKDDLEHEKIELNNEILEIKRKNETFFNKNQFLEMQKKTIENENFELKKKLEFMVKKT